MSGTEKPVYVTRQTVTIELPLTEKVEILNPEQVVLKIANTYIDIGALCYASRSTKLRKQRQPKDVVIGSLIESRPKQILKILKAISALVVDGGKSLITTANYARRIWNFIDWADNMGFSDCLAGGASTRAAFSAWVVDVKECYRRQQFDAPHHNSLLTAVCELLAHAIGSENLMQGVQKAPRLTNPNGGTDPLGHHDFVHAVALNQCLFDGLCDVVLENRPFPYKLALPASLEWKFNFLWIFPTNTWLSPPHPRDDTTRRKAGITGTGVYDYENGRIATVDEIAHRYSFPSKASKRRAARKAIEKATNKISEANANIYNTWRFSFGMLAQRAFQFLFICNTGSNLQDVRDLETDGGIEDSVLNQKFRSLKWRAGAKEITYVAPASFVPRLRRFMELRKYLLNGRNTPYLFFGCGTRNNQQPAQSSIDMLPLLYRSLLKFDPQLPKMGARKLRASVDDYYLRHHDSVVAAAVLQHSVKTGEQKYSRGSANDHREEMSRYMTAVSDCARRQRVVLSNTASPTSRSIEQGGHCEKLGHPIALADQVPVQPNCKDSQGCLFCSQRILTAEEEDTRKLASAAYVMEQLILGPQHEQALRPLITKCDEDLAKIAAFPHCNDMVQKVRKDVYENENLTHFWADKYNLFLELGILS